MKLLEGKVIAVTGGLGALGSAVARAAAREGARVVLIDRATRQGPLADELAHCAVLDGIDLTSTDAAAAAFDRLLTSHGRLDGLANVAGGFRWETIQDGHPDTWDLLFSINVKTALVATRAALPMLLRAGEGRIVNIGAGAAQKAGAGMGAYAAAKAGVARLTEALAAELKDRGVTANAILPSIIDTPQNRADMPDADSSRWVSPSSIADVVVFLLSARSRDISGALVPVFGRS